MKFSSVLICVWCGWCCVEASIPLIKDDDCCSSASGTCKQLCQQVFSTAYTIATADRLKKECPFDMVEFWGCVNQTVAESNLWFGKTCCKFSQSEKCEHACKNANSTHNVYHSCRRSDEPELYECMAQRQVAEECCSTAQNKYCGEACGRAFQIDLELDHEAYEAVVTNCSDNDMSVLRCVQNYTQKSTVVNLKKYIPCCDSSPNKICKETCRKLLHSTSTVQHVISELQNGGCGAPLLHDKFWQCFLQRNDGKTDSHKGTSVIKHVGMDSAKLHCCFAATSDLCKNLCTRTYSTEWSTTSDNFNKECLSFPSEEKLQYCLDEVEEPCELGCKGLSYCSNFNRPTELFRSCTSDSDDAARQEVELWQSQGFINVFGFQLPFRNITQCNPAVWKAFACILQIKPCQTNTQAIKICREDCHELLDQCLDWSRIPPGLSTSMLCSRFDYTSSEDPDKPCVSVKTFLQPAKATTSDIDTRIMIPCKNNACDKRSICTVDRQCYNNYQQCPLFQCVPGCRLGEISEYLVPVGTHVRLPVKTGNTKELCHKTCKCSANGVLNECQELPCVKPDPCYVEDTKMEHGSQFVTNCNICSCFAGETICTRKYCPFYAGLRLYENNLMSSTLPCNCLPHYIPVCGENGKTYHNSCLARCAGLTIADFTLGQCVSRSNGCDINPCKAGEICVPKRKVCLSLLSKPCPQYQCVNFKRSCNRYPDAPVCDEDNDEHRNLCHLIKKRKKLAYEGPCLKTCNRFEEVCGTDGNTYLSECAAHANYVQVDYKGRCAAVGLVGSHHQPCAAEGIKCAPLPDTSCHRIIPPGACCAVCAGAFRVLYSQKQVDRVIHKIGPSIVDVFTVETLIKTLEKYVRVIDCTIRGHLTTESDIVIMVTLSNPRKSQVLAEVCQKEAEKIAVMIQTSSPRITSELSLSVLTTAVLIPDLYLTTTSFYSSSSAIVVPFKTVYSALLGVCIVVFFKKWFIRVG